MSKIFMILGIDPGTTAAGYAFIEGGDTPALRASGILTVRAETAGERLAELHRALARLIAQWRPDAVAIEKLFFAANTKTAMTVAEARGVLLLTAVLGGTTVYEYTPAEIKKTITGQGNADKRQMRKMLGITMPETREMKGRDDVFDAIAVALTCHYKEKGRRHSIKE